ncbi:RNA-binding protein [Caballeronia sp. GAFFF1]|uniref:RNA recognition motif domain-containing protein n=1 Tax=Caballeronia sp. GAFFF1 TaxID=2921779 RepID=UPI002027BC83|nr:RNA-binding protein [Caballeronia sp. GAFFF1]
MSDLWLGNVEPNTTDDEIREFLCRYGFPAFDAIERVPGTGERPAAVVSFHSLEPHMLRTLQPRIHNMFWKDRTLVVQVMPERNET